MEMDADVLDETNALALLSSSGLVTGYFQWLCSLDFLTI